MAQKRRKPTTSTTRKKAAPRKADPKKLAQGAKLFTAKPISKTATRKPAPKTTQPSTLLGALAQTKRNLAGTKVTVLSIPWEAQQFAKSLGVVRHPLLKVHLYEGNILPFQLEPYRSVDYSFERWIEDELNSKIKQVQSIKSVMKPRAHQVKAIRKIENAGKAGWRGFILADGVGIGKGLAGSTLIPTPNGMVKMEDLCEGNEVLGLDGKPTRILEKHISKANHFYEITFSDNTIIHADEDHRWVTQNTKEKKREWSSSERVERITKSEEKDLVNFLTEQQNNKLAIGKRDLSVFVTTNKSYVASILNGIKPVGKVKQATGRPYNVYHPQEVLEKVNNNLFANNRWGGSFEYKSIKTTKEILETLEIPAANGKLKSNHFVPVAAAVYSEKPLPIHPYVLGTWLGDGSSYAGNIFSAEPDIIEHISQLGFDKFTSVEQVNLDGSVNKSKTYRIIGLITSLRELFGQEKGKIEKKIPDIYMLGSREQRIELLKGLLDTDGSVGRKPSSGVTFSQKDPYLFFQVLELIASLGFKATWRKRNTSWTHKDVENTSESYELLFYPQEQVFYTEKKRDLLEGKIDSFRKNSERHNQRVIRSIKEIPKTEEYYCISVDSPDHQYLCTESFIPTHNTISAIFGSYVVAKNKGFTPEKPAQVLIVAPKSALPHWRNTIKATGVNNMRIVVINYDQAKKLLDAPASASQAKKTSTVNKHTAEKGKTAIHWDIIIADEAHKMKNNSQRTAAFTKIARYADTAAKAPFVIWASATIGQQPLELGYLAPVIGQLTGHAGLSIDNWGEWLIENRFNVKKSKAGNFSWVKALPESNPSDIALIKNQQRKDVERLGSLLFDVKSPSIRRNPEDIAGWPSQTYTPTPLQLSSEGKRLYDEAWQEFRKYIGLNPRGKNPSGGFAATMRFRQKASLLSALPTAEFVNDLLENGLQVAISVEFLETLDVIKDYLEKQGWNCAEISGRPDNGLDREKERVRFQKGEAQVMLFTVLEAISLHAGEQLADGTKSTSTTRAMVVHDIRYSGLDMTQIIGRTTRDGQLANAFLMFTEGTVEAKILGVVLNRIRNMKTLSGDDEATFTQIEDILDTF